VAPKSFVLDNRALAPLVLAIGAFCLAAAAESAL
jgi:hypothetical protein